MPNRILRDYTDSLRFDGLSAEAERLFIRLIIKADDYGRFHAEPRLLRAGCFPLNDNLRANDLDRWLDELSRRQLILRYEAAGRKLLAIVNFGQRLRDTKWKFPPPDGQPPTFIAEWPQVAANGGELPPETKGGGDGKRGGGGDEPPPPENEDAHIPTVDEVIAAGGPAGIPAEYCREFHEKTSEKRMWLNSYKRLTDWRKTLVRFWRGDQGMWQPKAQPIPPQPDYLKTEWPAWLEKNGHKFVEYQFAEEFKKSDFHKERKKK